MTLDEMIRSRFGDVSDPLAGVGPNEREEAEKAIALWSEAPRSDLRTLARLDLSGWSPTRRAVVAKVLARRILACEGRVREAATLALGNVDDHFRRI